MIALLRQRGMTRHNLTQRDHSEAREWRQRGTTRLLMFGVTCYRVTVSATAWVARSDNVASCRNVHYVSLKIIETTWRPIRDTMTAP